MKKGRTYKVKMPKHTGGWKTLTVKDVIPAGVAMTKAQVREYYGVPLEKKKVLKGYIRPLRTTTRYVFVLPASLVKACGIRGAKYMVLTDSFGPPVTKKAD